MDTRTRFEGSRWHSWFSNWTASVYKALSVYSFLLQLQMCQYRPFPHSAVFYTSICYQSQSIHTQPITKVDITPFSIKRSLCPVTLCNYKCLNIGHFHNIAVFCTSICYQSEWNPACWRWSIPPSCNINSFSYCHISLSQTVSVGVVTRDKVKWFRGNLTAFSVSQPTLLVSITINRTLAVSHSLLSVAQVHDC